jgi:hypothetical protein
MIELVIGFHKDNRSPILEKFLGRIGDLSARLQAGTA